MKKKITSDVRYNAFPSRAWDYAHKDAIGLTGLGVLFTLYEFQYIDENTKPSFVSIARKCGISARSVKDYIPKLESFNMVNIERKKRDNGENFNNKYHLVSPEKWRHFSKSELENSAPPQKAKVETVSTKNPSPVEKVEKSPRVVQNLHTYSNNLTLKSLVDKHNTNSDSNGSVFSDESALRASSSSKMRSETALDLTSLLDQPLKRPRLSAGLRDEFIKKFAVWREVGEPKNLDADWATNRRNMSKLFNDKIIPDFIKSNPGIEVTDERLRECFDQVLDKMVGTWHYDRATNIGYLFWNYLKIMDA